MDLGRPMMDELERKTGRLMGLRETELQDENVLKGVQRRVWARGFLFRCWCLFPMLWL